MPSTVEVLGICFVTVAVLYVSFLWLELAYRAALKRSDMGKIPPSQNPVQIIKDTESVSDRSLTLQVPVSQTMVEDLGRESSDSEKNNVANKVAMPSQPPPTYPWDELRGPLDNSFEVIPSAPREDPHICGSTRIPQSLRAAARPHAISMFAINVEVYTKFRPWIPTPIKRLLLTKGRGYACVFPENAEQPIWVPARNIKPATDSQPEPAEQDQDSALLADAPALSSYPKKLPIATSVTIVYPTSSGQPLQWPTACVRSCHS